MAPPLRTDVSVRTSPTSPTGESSYPGQDLLEALLDDAHDLAALNRIRRERGGALEEDQSRRYDELKGTVPPAVLQLGGKIEKVERLERGLEALRKGDVDTDAMNMLRGYGVLPRNFAWNVQGTVDEGIQMTQAALRGLRREVSRDQMSLGKELVALGKPGGAEQPSRAQDMDRFGSDRRGLKLVDALLGDAKDLAALNRIRRERGGALEEDQSRRYDELKGTVTGPALRLGGKIEKVERLEMGLAALEKGDVDTDAMNMLRGYGVLPKNFAWNVQSTVDEGIEMTRAAIQTLNGEIKTDRLALGRDLLALGNNDQFGPGSPGNSDPGGAPTEPGRPQRKIRFGETLTSIATEELQARGLLMGLSPADRAAAVDKAISAIHQHNMEKKSGAVGESADLLFAQETLLIPENLAESITGKPPMTGREFTRGRPYMA